MSFGTRPSSASRSRPPSQSRDRKARPSSATSLANDPVLGGGARGVRQLRRQRDGENSSLHAKENRPLSSSRQRPATAGNENPLSPTRKGKSRVEAARMYLSERVDPLMSNIISFLLAEQPSRPDEAILKYLEAKQAGIAPRPSSAKRRSSDGSRNALLRDRLYMGRKVQPVLEHLMRHVVEEQPADVVGHFIGQLKAGITERKLSKENQRNQSTELNDGDNAEVADEISPKRKPRSKAKSSAPSYVSPPVPSKGACDALFRMLDEDGSGSMTAAQLVGRLAALHACGVPIDSTARAFWSSVELSSSDGAAGGPGTVIDRECFFATMVRVAETAETWMPEGAARPKLSLVLPAATPSSSSTPSAAPSSRLQVSSTSTQPSAVAASSSPPKGVGDGESSSTRVLEVGAPVSVNYRKSGNFFPGKISAVNPSSGTYSIAYNDGDSEANVKPAMITALDAEGKSLSVVVVAPGEHAKTSPDQQTPVPPAVPVEVGSRVEVKYRGGTGNWYKGKVVALNGGGTFNVEYDDGDKEAGVKLQHLKLLDAATGLPVPCAGSAHDPSNAQEGGAHATAPGVALKAMGIKPTVAILGTSGAGKSVLLKAMGGDPEPKPRPTTGFTQKKMDFALPDGGGEVSVHWYDLPGSWTKKWDEYLAEAHAVVYVVDASAPQDGQVDPKLGTGGGFAHACDVFSECARGRHVAGKPMLVLANKDDVQGARSAQAVSEALGVNNSGGNGDDEEGDVKVVGCTTHPVMNGGEFDGRVEAGLEWLLGKCVLNFEHLSKRVKAAEAEAEAERAKEKVERARRVFTKVLKEKAFPPDGEEPLETFSEVDGYEFLAMELLIHDPQDPAKTRSAEEFWGLSDVAQRVCRLVGFQKMAMIMCADMINPEQKKNKETRSWEEVVAYVMDRREEAGLTRDLPANER